MPGIAFNRRSAIARLASIGMAASVLMSTPRSSAAQATPGRAPVPANHFTLTGDGVEVDYSASSISGQPMLTYRGPEGKLTFTGRQIEVTPSQEFGELVSVLIDSVADGYSLFLTLLLPGVNLAAGEPTPFSTIAIATKHRTTIAGPGLLEGALKEYQAFMLNGTASLVES